MSTESRERLERLYGAGLEPSPWRKDMVWTLDGVEITERECHRAWAHFEATDERPDWWSSTERRTGALRLVDAVRRWRRSQRRR